MKKARWPGEWKVVCSTCEQEKDITDFYIHSNGKPRKQCKGCLMSRANPSPENRKKLYAEYRARNPEKVKQRTTNWRKNNLEYDAFRASTYRATKAQRTPQWACLDKIKDIYLNCPKEYHVDHIYPLRGKYVSGLHVPENLQYLEAKKNLSKRNIYVPS